MQLYSSLPLVQDVSIQDKIGITIRNAVCYQFTKRIERMELLHGRDHILESPCTFGDGTGLCVSPYFANKLENAENRFSDPWIFPRAAATSDLLGD